MGMTMKQLWTKGEGLGVKLVTCTAAVSGMPLSIAFSPH